MSGNLRAEVRKALGAVSSRDQVDLAAEGARYGELRWERDGFRHYSRVTGGGSEMTTVGPGGAGVTYVVVGLDVEEVV